MRFKTRQRLALAASLGLVAGCGQTMVSKPAAASTGGVASASVELAKKPAVPCGGGVIQDDGTVETGYGFVPSSVMGQFVQRLRVDAPQAAALDKVCVCWLRSRADAEIDFEVVFYEDAQGRPVNEPYAAVAATASEVPRGVDDAGRFWEVDVSGISVRPGTSYVGVRWDPSRDPFFFVCTDTSPKTPRTDVFMKEDRAPAWTHVKDSRDPIFSPHRAILVRAASR